MALRRSRAASTTSWQARSSVATAAGTWAAACRTRTSAPIPARMSRVMPSQSVLIQFGRTAVGQPNLQPLATTPRPLHRSSRIEPRRTRGRWHGVGRVVLDPDQAVRQALRHLRRHWTSNGLRLRICGPAVSVAASQGPTCAPGIDRLVMDGLLNRGLAPDPARLPLAGAEASLRDPTTSEVVDWTGRSLTGKYSRPLLLY